MSDLISRKLWFLMLGVSMMIGTGISPVQAQEKAEISKLMHLQIDCSNPNRGLIEAELPSR